MRIQRQDGKVAQYTIAFYRQSGEWYDEIRYDSHERKRGKQIDAPHLHMKIHSAFKGDPERAVEELKGIIDNYLGNVEEVAKR